VPWVRDGLLWTELVLGLEFRVRLGLGLLSGPGQMSSSSSSLGPLRHPGMTSTIGTSPPISE